MELHRRGARRQPVRVRVSRRRRPPRASSCGSSTRRSATRAGRRSSRDVDLGSSAGDRIGLLGPNGAGKSTLLKAIAGDARAASRRRATRAQGLRLGYFAQHQVEQLRAGAVAAVAPAAARARHARAGVARLPRRLRLSRRHGHGGRSADFSGGEKARLDAGADRPPEAQPAAARRADQPPRHRDARSADRSAAGLRRRAGRGRARPPPAARDDRRAVARRRRRRRAVRRRPRRLPRLGAEPRRRERADAHRGRPRRGATARRRSARKRRRGRGSPTRASRCSRSRRRSSARWTR